MRCTHPIHAPIPNPAFSSLLERRHAASITAIPQTAGEGNMETESMTQNTEGKDKVKRVTMLEISANVNTGVQTQTGARLPSF